MSGSHAAVPAVVTVRYWAGAKAAAGVDSEPVRLDGATTLDRLVGEVLARHADRPRLREVIGVCSVLIGDRPVGAADPELVVLHDGDVVEFLPPFAGG